jgi:hypothetical protein
MQLVCRQVKGYLARHSTTFKLRDVFGLVSLALLQIMAQRWQADIDHVIKEEGRMW